ncbi:NAD(P)-dependent alcohol dehydrogenase [Acidovorax sp.]|uniref:NAD(P)-dependent alcohol dehydrogenase n=1 Tax=Acidovorax sp. TaxID=1872122 RepID=UPI00261003D8|nr:NAD(P)-dependent alcohol dehydrogenase [Acidovorax sp.]
MSAIASPSVSDTMQAWACRDYGGPEMLALQAWPRPKPGPHEVLVRVRAASVSSADVRIRTQNLPRGFGVLGRLVFGLTRPRQPVLGTDMAGVVVAVGHEVQDFRPGDAVIGVTGTGMGCHAEYCVLPAGKPLVLKPAQLSFAEAASLPFGGLTALHYLRKAQLQAGETVLVVGASGAVGSAMVQLARHMGAQVTGVCGAGNAPLVRSLGAHAVIDYAQQDFTQAAMRWDVIADTVGTSSFAACLPCLNEHGRYLSVAGTLMELLARPHGTRRSIGGPAQERTDDLATLIELAKTGVLQPVIDRIYPFAELPAAHAYVQTGRKRGAVIVTWF